MIDDDELLQLAALRLNAAKANLEEDVNTWVTELARLDDDDVLMTFSASDIMAGKRFSLTTRNRDVISRHRSLAEHMGASVEEIDRGEATELVIGPPSHQ
jgi:hypothetical protein